MPINEIIVLFKTHLDVGFTDFSQRVVESYLTSYIPKAIEVARAMRGREERFIWTTGSWMIREFLRRSPLRAELEESIRQGDVRWHGLPFTTHTELMDEDLFRHGLSISQELDQQFGLVTQAAKMTDVPGHTRAMVPHLAQAGIRFLHIGVNSAATPPQVPPLFRWRAPSGEELLVMYQHSYGDFMEIGTTGTAICFAHTGDNQGPQSTRQIEAVYSKLRRKYPQARLRAGTLEDAAKAAERAEDLPIVTGEIGDTWIQGVGSDPGKVSRYRAILRLCKELPEPERKQAYDQLLLVPEHTWGLDEKTHLGALELCERRYFIRKDFEKAKLKDERFQRMEQSWLEQRGYVESAVNSLSWESRGKAEVELLRTAAAPLDLEGFEHVSSLERISINGYLVSIDEHGSVCRLEYDGELLADNEHRWGTVLYEAFSQQDYDRYLREYIVSRESWAVEDNEKAGTAAAISQHLTAVPNLEAVWRQDNELICQLSMDGDAHFLYGAPKKLALCWRFLPDRICLDLRWWEKPETRVAEALWLGMQPFGQAQAVRKLSEWINVEEVVTNGGRRLHATDFGVRYGGFTMECLDSALVNIGRPALLSFPKEPPDYTEGVFFNLYNNVWGTNFVMWYGEDARFRFTISSTETNRKG